MADALNGIVVFLAENFKKLRMIEIRPDGKPLVQITGRNGQGKTSVLDALWFALKGKKALPDKAVRRGTETMKVHLDLGEFTVTRTLGNGSSLPTLKLEMKDGSKQLKPQEFLDGIFGELTFDPLNFMRMTPAEQVIELHKTAKVNLDFAKLAEENDIDYKDRHKLALEIKTLEAQLKGKEVLAGLPKQKLDEAAIMARLNQAGDAQRKAQELFRAKQELGAAAAHIGVEKIEQDRRIEQQKQKIELLKKELAAAEAGLVTLETERSAIAARQKEAEKAFQAAPAGEPVDVGALTAELQAAQRTNRAIDQRREYDELLAEAEAKRQAWAIVDSRMTGRDEQKKEAIRKAKIPVDGLTFDETSVTYNGLPLENLGEGEQIRISTLIGMAANPKLRILCIRHGEALDDEGVKIIAGMAKEHDFQVWMARVDSSGKTGLVIEDGMIVKRNKDEPEEEEETPAGQKQKGRVN